MSSDRFRLPIARRDLLLGGVTWGAFGVACQRQQPFTCTDVSALNPEQLGIRDKLNYRDKAPKAELACEVCTQYLPPPGGEGCGGCKVMPGPTHPHGSCKVFAKKA